VDTIEWGTDVCCSRHFCRWHIVAVDRFEVLNRRVLRMLIIRWSPRLNRWLVTQSPLYILPKSPVLFYKTLNAMVAEKFITNTVPEIMLQVISRMSLRECYVCHVRALRFVGSASGNHGESNFIDAKRTLKDWEDSNRGWSSDFCPFWGLLSLFSRPSSSVASLDDLELGWSSVGGWFCQLFENY
jgi:hypothetical protein